MTNPEQQQHNMVLTELEEEMLKKLKLDEILPAPEKRDVPPKMKAMYAYAVQQMQEWWYKKMSVYFTQEWVEQLKQMIQDKPPEVKLGDKKLAFDAKEVYNPIVDAHELRLNFKMQKAG